ncbi:MAG: amino acid-binding protein [Clostridia bacterium]|nr:amino acid-binding protein [Clostridia bacterium]
MTIYQISVFIENKQGRLTEIVKTLSTNGIDIRALSVADTTDFGILRIIVNDPEAAIKVLKAEGVTVSKTQVIGVSFDDKTGALTNVLELLSNAGISVEYAYAFITHSKNNASVILRVEQVEEAIKVLTDAGVSLIDTIE